MKLNHQETAGFSPCGHLPGFHFGVILFSKTASLAEPCLALAGLCQSHLGANCPGWWENLHVGTLCSLLREAKGKPPFWGYPYSVISDVAANNLDACEVQGVSTSLAAGMRMCCCITHALSQPQAVAASGSSCLLA